MRAAKTAASCLADIADTIRICYKRVALNLFESYEKGKFHIVLFDFIVHATSFADELVDVVIDNKQQQEELPPLLSMEPLGGVWTPKMVFSAVKKVLLAVAREADTTCNQLARTHHNQIMNVANSFVYNLRIAIQKAQHIQPIALSTML